MIDKARAAQLAEQIERVRFHTIASYLQGHPECEFAYIVNRDLAEFAALICDAATETPHLQKAIDDKWLHRVITARNFEDQASWVIQLQDYLNEQRTSFSRDCLVIFVRSAFIVMFA